MIAAGAVLAWVLGVLAVRAALTYSARSSSRRTGGER
ncbi:hypothetical protein QEH31_gp37 [Streptomyces phage Chymera]|uniref:Uncharacterized protein n=1 Tax=Streptomyces phage Chymera TaxID=1821728 RepID=A0A142K663_9CAUD|nr:hypothetical protein QEH31_gp37 [Streptomyces phage Chymera]AMS01596.1 hypothetical protein SEA_CHYMERA_37 [Streptomyces phage Chymera]